MDDCGWVEGQLFEQSNDLIIVSDVVPRESKVFLVLFESVDVPMKIARLDTFGLVA